MTHEDFSRRQPAHRLANRTFGLTISVPLTVIGLVPLRHGHPVRLWALAAAATLVLLALVRPAWLAPLNAAWSRITGVLNIVLLHVTAALLLYLVFAPINLVFRIAGRDPLRLRRDPGAGSYWIPRDPPGPAPDSMINQF